MKRKPLDYPMRDAQSPDEEPYIKLHNRITGEKYIYSGKDCKFHGKDGLWKKHLEWIEFIALLKYNSVQYDKFVVVADAIASSRFWWVDDFCGFYEEPGVIYG